MDTQLLFAAVRESLQAITEPRFYETERGFQGQLLIELSKRIPNFLPRDLAIIEQEHQKTLEHHGLRIRPDIIIHKPFNPELHASRQKGNFAVIELKLRARPKKAIEDFSSIQSMLRVLDYPVGIFINIDQTRTQIEHAPSSCHGKLVAFSTKLMKGRAFVRMARA